jgi:hypothetical protein
MTAHECAVACGYFDLACVQDNQILRVFDRKNDGFFVHDRDAYYVARTFYKSTTMVSQLKVKVGGKDETLESIHLNRSMFEAVLQDVLITKGNRVVELYEGHGASWQIARCVYHVLTIQLHSDLSVSQVRITFKRSNVHK